MQFVGGHGLSKDFSDPDDYSFGINSSLRKPPTILFFGGLASVILGAALGLFGIYGIQTAIVASSSMEYLIGFGGYLLTAIIPIILLQIIKSRHQNYVKNNNEEPYDLYAGNILISKYLKVVFFGLIAAAPCIWVFFQPIAEVFA